MGLRRVEGRLLKLRGSSPLNSLAANQSAVGS